MARAGTFKKGHKKNGGRKKGTPNKKTQEFLKILEEVGFCPVRAKIRVYRRALRKYDELNDPKRVGEDSLMRLGFEFKTDPRSNYLSIAADAAEDLMQYTHPKRKAIELSGPGGGPIDVRDQQTPEERHQRLKELREIFKSLEEDESGEAESS